MALSDVFFRPSVLTFILFIIAYGVYSQIKRNRRTPKGLPWSHKDDRIKSASSVPEKLQKMKEVVSILLCFRF